MDYENNYYDAKTQSCWKGYRRTTKGGVKAGEPGSCVKIGDTDDLIDWIDAVSENISYDALLELVGDSLPEDELIAIYESKSLVGDSDEDIDAVYKKYHATVNMSATELEAWSKTSYSKAASISRSPITRNLRLLRTPKSEWTAATARSANRTISFVSRMKGAMGENKPISKEIPFSKAQISLRNWAYKP
jgi:hypothetical protein